jgi:hypothetical protein
MSVTSTTETALKMHPKRRLVVVFWLQVIQLARAVEPPECGHVRVVPEMVLSLFIQHGNPSLGWADAIGRSTGGLMVFHGEGLGTGGVETTGGGESENFTHSS